MRRMEGFRNARKLMDIGIEEKNPGAFYVSVGSLNEFINTELYKQAFKFYSYDMQACFLAGSGVE